MEAGPPKRETPELDTTGYPDPKTYPTPRYKDAQGRYITKSLFYETNRGDSSLPSYFTLRHQDYAAPFMGYKVLPSMKRLYLEIADPTEYQFAMQVLGSWEHWQKLLECSWFIPEVREWRDTLEVKLRCQGIKAILSKAPDSLDAAKWLAEGKFKEDHRKGKDKRIREQKIRNDIRATLDDDAKRLGITAGDSEGISLESREGEDGGGSEPPVIHRPPITG